MISALKKISKNPNVPIKDKSIASIFIENPLKNKFNFFANLFDNEILWDYNSQHLYV